MRNESKSHTTGKDWARGLRLQERHPLWKGDDASEKTKRDRARRWYPLAGQVCEGCGVPATQRHHRDGNPANNDATNIAFVCATCHFKADGRLEELARRKREAPRITHCLRGHEYTPENTYWQGRKRSCKVCRKAAREQYRRRKRG